MEKRDLKEKLLLVGAGGLGRVVLEHARDKYECAFVDDGRKTGSAVCGVNVIGNTHDLPQLFCEYKLLIVSIGDNRIREKIYQYAAQIGYGFPNIICPSAYVSPYAAIGQGCIFLNNVVVQNNAAVGNGVILNPGVEIHHDSRVKDYVLIYTNSVIRSMAEIGNRAWIGSTLTVSNKAVISDDGILENGRTV